MDQKLQYHEKRTYLFCLSICAFQWTKAKWCFLSSLLSLHFFGLKNEKKNFEEKKGFECSFFFE